MLKIEKKLIYKEKPVLIVAEQIGANKIECKANYEEIDGEHFESKITKPKYAEHRYLNDIDMHNALVYYYNHLEEYELKEGK